MNIKNVSEISERPETRQLIKREIQTNETVSRNKNFLMRL